MGSECGDDGRSLTENVSQLAAGVLEHLQHHGHQYPSDQHHHDWEDTSSQAHDETRSWSSQKSESGYASDGNEPTSHAATAAAAAGATRYHQRQFHAHHRGGGGGRTSSVHSFSSVGAHEDMQHERRLAQYRAIAASTVRLMNGETRFPTAMSYQSDAPRSDVATVCSGSMVDDFEMESVLSQEDHHSITYELAAATLTASLSPMSSGGGTPQHHSSSFADKLHRKSAIGASRMVEFAPETTTHHMLGASGAGGTTTGTHHHHHLDTAYHQYHGSTTSKSSLVLPTAGIDTDGTAGPAALAAGDDIPAHNVTVHAALNCHCMGPPLSRALLMQKADGAFFAPRSGSVKSFGSNGTGCGRGGGNHSVGHQSDCGGSLDGETHSVHRYSEIMVAHLDDTDDCAKPASESKKALRHGDEIKVDRLNLEPSSLAGSVKSGVGGEMDDCGNSLDVETHSVGARSVHSQDDVAMLPPSIDAAKSMDTANGNAGNGIDKGLSAAATAAAVATPAEGVAVVANPLLVSNIGSGRCSPGGTIYKGRGTRRYQGRYMHLPLKRFHHNVDVTASSVALEHSDASSPDNDNDDGLRRIGYHLRPRSRSRSRSRSPIPAEAAAASQRPRRRRSSDDSTMKAHGAGQKGGRRR